MSKMKRIDLSFPGRDSHFAQMGAGINEIMRFLEAEKNPRPSWGPSVQEMVDEGFNRKEAIKMRDKRYKEIADWDETYG